MHRCACWLLLVVAQLVVLGCDDAPEAVTEPEPPATGGERFDLATAGTIEGRVVWRGTRPVVAPFRSIPEPLTDQPPLPARDWPNPHAPTIDEPSSGLADAVVWLKKVDPAIARPWDLPAVRVEARGQRFHVLQGGTDGRTGFVRPHGYVELVSRDPVFHSVHVRGIGGRCDESVFFSCMLPDRNKVVSRRMEGPEIVELTSGCGYFWMRAYLFVSPHPYLVQSDARGRFILPRVPAGRYEVLAWHPDWHVRERERNPDSMRVQQVRFGSPLESRRNVVVEPGKTATVTLSLSAHRERYPASPAEEK